MKPQKYIRKVLYVLYALCLLVFFSSSGFRDKTTTGGWYQQFFPYLNGSTIASLTFLNSLTGFGVTSLNPDTLCYILKTTNGGDNWNIIFTYHTAATTVSFNKIQFANNIIGYASINDFILFKTTNGGDNWNTIYTGLYPQDMAVINKDTILFVYNSLLTGGVWRTTNGGLNWSPLGPTGGSGQPYNIYMFNKDMGFCLGGQMRKTTNGGVNWFAIPGETYSGIQFVDSLTGWKCYDSIKKTTNGGINWVTQIAPKISHTFDYSCFSALNKDTIWLVGARVFSHAPVYKTTNGGLNWGYQIPDTTLQIYSYGYISFVNAKVGWANPGGNFPAIHTTTGGNDTTFYTGIKLVEEYVPTGYLLKQNYPNPFNPQTNIPFELSESGYVTLKVYDITGREVKELINGKWGKASYVAEFNAENLASGIYFYRLRFVSDATKKEFVDTKKMMLLK